MNLRPYQYDAQKMIREQFSKNIRRVILQIPTGGGKTVVFSSIAKQVIERGKRVLILCNRKELIQQAKEKLNEFGLYPTVIIPKNKIVDNFVFVASVDTLRNREFPKIDLLIVDECHIQTFDPIINKYLELIPDLFVIGATATPIRTGNQNSLHLIYQTIVNPIEIHELIDSGFLVPCQTFSAKENFSDVKIRAGEYDSRALYEKFTESNLYNGMIEKYKQFADGTRAICFNVNVEHSIRTTKQFNDAGISCRHVDGSTPDAERKQILTDFKNGEFQILSNCAVLTTGFDEPSIETVIINRATTSMSLYLQMIGRGSRLYKNKKSFKCIDMGANVWRFGLWSEPRVFELEKKKKRETLDSAPVKFCLKCESINHISAKVCKFCDEPFQIKEKKLKESEFIEVKEVRKLIPMSRRNLGAIAKQNGYSNGWIHYQLKKFGR